MSDARIQDIVDAISDGEQIDWEAVRRRSKRGNHARFVTELETVSKISQLTQDTGNGAREDVREPLWVPVLMGIALFQIVLGIIGAIGYRLHSFADLLRLLTILSFGGVGLVLRQNRKNARARDLGAFLMLRAFGFSRTRASLVLTAWFPGSAMAEFLRSGLALEAWTPFFAWRFARRFPVTSRFTAVDRLAIVFTTIAGTVGAFLFSISLIGAIWHPVGAIWTFVVTSFPGQQRFYSTTLALTLPALPVILIRARAAEDDERARVQWFALAMVVGAMPQCLELLIEEFVPAYAAHLRESESFANNVAVGLVLPMLTIPFSTAYSVLIHQMFDVRFVVRQGVRYLFARWTLVGLTLLPFGLLAWHVYARRHDSVIDVFGDQRGVTLLVLVALGGIALLGRRWFVHLIDRWFDRRGVDRTTVLARSGDALRLVRTRSELVASVASAARGALNASASVYFYDRRRHAYLPFERGSLPLPGDSALASVLLQEPALSLLRTDSEQSIARYLPRTERLWIGDANVSVVAPIRSTGVERPAGLIAFGPRRDALGYSRDDEQFVTALASATGIAFENLRLKSEAVGDEAADDFGMLCARCHRVTDFVEAQRLCPCGGELQAAAVPRRINGKFLVEALLGAGGMGVAYLASDIALNRYVAIKTLPSVSADAMARLQREARTMAALSHPNLATILGHESWRGTPILVCEYLHGGTLQQRLARQRLTPVEAVDLGLKLLEALEYMHGEGVLHRDIKPSNIAFTSDKTPKLLDFGLAGMMERARPDAGPRSGGAPMLGTTLAGTVAYLPPQAFANQPPTPQFDLWALTVVLFESIVGRHPFAAGVDTAENICRSRFVVSLDAQRDLPGGVKTFLSLALNPHTRQFESSTAMRETLTALRVSLRS